MIELHFGGSATAVAIPWGDLAAAAMPHVIWVALIVFGALWIGRDAILLGLTRIDRVTIGGFEVGFRRELEDAALARNQAIAELDLGRAARRLAGSAALLRGARLLWVDDSPANNRVEERLFRQAGAEIVWAIDTRGALRHLDERPFDLVLSDIRRPGDPKAGLAMAEVIAGRPVSVPVILYTGAVRGSCPASVFGIADRPDALVHLVLDALARVRG